MNGPDFSNEVRPVFASMALLATAEAIGNQSDRYVTIPAKFYI
jgi:hypothetical protein